MWASCGQCIGHVHHRSPLPIWHLTTPLHALYHFRVCLQCIPRLASSSHTQPPAVRDRL